MSAHSPELQIPRVIADLLSQALDPSSQQVWQESIQALPDDLRSTLLGLLQELTDHSTKAAAAGLRHWNLASTRLSSSELLSWIDLGTAVASHSATAAAKYFQDSVAWVGPLSPSQRKAVFETALDLADRNYGVIPDFLKASPHAMAVLPLDSLPLWVKPGLDLAEADIVLAVEYFRISPALLNSLSADDLYSWVNLGMRLVAPNQFGKPDYLRAIEYFRLGPKIFSSLSPPDLHPSFIKLATRLATVSPEATIEFLRLAPDLLQSLPSSEIRQRVLEQGLRLADRKPEVVGDYLKQVPQVLELMNDSLPEFDRWVDAGYRLLSQSASGASGGGLEKAKAYFDRRSKTGQETTERLAGGLPLSRVARILKLYAEGLSGRRVVIRSTEDLPLTLREQLGSGPTTDGRAIYLPKRIRFSSEPQDNFRFYKIATLHEVGHLEFGTYDLDFSSAADLTKRLHQRYREAPASSQITTAEAFFFLYPDPSWARTLWEILEDARIDYLLRLEYPGIRKDMDRIVAFELRHRPSLERLPLKQAIREALLHLSITDTTEVPLELAPVISQAYDLLLEMKRPQAKALDALKTLESLYVLLEQWMKTHSGAGRKTDPLQARDKNPQEEYSQEGSGPDSVPTSSFSYRGSMHPDWVKTVRQTEEDSSLPHRLQDLQKDRSATVSTASQTMAVPFSEHHAFQEKIPPANELHPSRSGPSGPSGERCFFYDEWDGAAQDYRPRWSRLVEKPLHHVTNSFVQDTLTQYGGVVRLLRRYFEALKPEAFRKLKRQMDGEEMDLDALLETYIEARAGGSPSDRVYIKTEKRVRDVAVAFLLDMSGSTSRYIGHSGKKVIDVEKEGLVLLSEALQAVGDAYGIFGFSGQGRDQVEFFLLKDFDEDIRWTLPSRIGAVRPFAQNRDGAAIRHTIHKLLQQPARTRLLILMSDGKPLDTDYTGAYALQDTKMALREARMKGIHPYCITIDREATKYVSEMYGEVRYTIIDNVLSLPARLPQIYRRLTT